MKNIKLLLAACAALLVFGACGNGQQQTVKEDNKETTVTTSPDLTYCDLQGPVKSCDYYEFDRSGRLVTVNGMDPFSIEGPSREFDTVTFDVTDICKWSRNNQGQISSIECYEMLEEFTWSGGRVVESIAYFEGQKTLTVNEYDNEGRLVKQSLYNGMEDENVESKDESMLFGVNEYNYLEFDNHGNWIRRNVKWSDAVVEYVDEQEETRKIEYYE